MNAHPNPCAAVINIFLLLIQNQFSLSFPFIGLQNGLCLLFIVVQSLSLVWVFTTPWTAACQASLPFTISQNLLKLMFIVLTMHPTISSTKLLFFIMAPLIFENTYHEPCSTHTYTQSKIATCKWNECTCEMSDNLTW